MKPIFLLFFFFILIIKSYGQLYLKVNAKYNHGFGGDKYTSYDQNINVSKDLSLGGGYSVGLDFFADISDIFSIELGGSRVSGHVIDVKPDKFTLQSKYYLISSSLVAKSKGKLVNPYIKFGPAMMNAQILSTNISTYHNGLSITKYSKGWSFGFQGGAGIFLDINDNIQFMLELNLLQMDYSPGRGEIIVLRQNNNDIIDKLTTSERYAIYKKRMKSSYQPEDYLPTEMPKFNIPFDNAGAQMSVAFKLF